jgi:hypothetical protein
MPQITVWLHILQLPQGNNLNTQHSHSSILYKEQPHPG